jgi:hypothetical protein
MYANLLFFMLCVIPGTVIIRYNPKSRTMLTRTFCHYGYSYSYKYIPCLNALSFHGPYTHRKLHPKRITMNLSAPTMRFRDGRGLRGRRLGIVADLRLRRAFKIVIRSKV